MGPHGDPIREGLRAEDLQVSFGPVRALDGVSLAVEPGEVVAVVGPSGCGKSTLLRAIAGLQPAAGSVRWNGRDVGGLRPDRRGFGLMFQDHALFAHRTVGENIAFGPRMAGVGGGGRREVVARMLDLVGLPGHEDRRVDTLSGGEAQRIALARSLAPSPHLLMLDEPLGSLDRALRERLTTDLRRILTTAGVAAVHVTHDQDEAYAIADRIVVMDAGRIERDGPAGEVWADPGSISVARFLGHRNILDLAAAASLGLAAPTSAAALLVHERAITIRPTGSSGSHPATVTGTSFRGPVSTIDLEMRTPAGEVIALHLVDAEPRSPGERVALEIDPTAVAPLLAGGER